MAKDIGGKPVGTADSSKTVSKRTGHIGANKRSKFVNTMDNSQESSLHGHSNDSGGNPSSLSDGEHFSNNSEHQTLMSPIALQQMTVKNQVLRTPSGGGLSRRNEIAKGSRISTPASLHHRRMIDPLVQPSLDDDEDSAEDNEVDVNTDDEEDEDDEEIIEDDYIHGVSAGVKQRHLEPFPGHSGTTKEKVFQVTVRSPHFLSQGHIPIKQLIQATTDYTNTTLQEAIDKFVHKGYKLVRPKRKYDTAKLDDVFIDHGREVFNRLISAARQYFIRNIDIPDSQFPILINHAVSGICDENTMEFNALFKKLREWRKNWARNYIQGAQEVLSEIRQQNPDWNGLTKVQLRGLYQNKFSFEYLLHMMAHVHAGTIDWRSSLNHAGLNSLYRTIFTWTIVSVLSTNEE